MGHRKWTRKRPLPRFPKQDYDAVKLLREWYDWWWATEEAPAKMPDALHIRTATFFLLRGDDPSWPFEPSFNHGPRTIEAE